MVIKIDEVDRSQRPGFRGGGNDDRHADEAKDPQEAEAPLRGGQ